MGTSITFKRPDGKEAAGYLANAARGSAPGVVVMEKGRVVETALSADIFARPEHAYTRKLMRATPRLGVSLRDLLPEGEAAALTKTSPRLRGEHRPPSAAVLGKGRRSKASATSPLAIRVRGAIRESEYVERAPHPDPLPAKSGEREMAPARAILIA